MLGMPTSVILGMLASATTVAISTPPQVMATAIMTPVNETGESKQPMVMTTSFIRQQIDMGIHDIMHQVSKQLADIMKPMVHNELQQAKEMEAKCANESSVTSAIAEQAGQPNPNTTTQTGPSQFQPSQAQVTSPQPNFVLVGTPTNPLINNS